MSVFKNFWDSRFFLDMQLISVNSTNCRIYWDKLHVQLGIRTWSSECEFSKTFAVLLVPSHSQVNSVVCLFKRDSLQLHTAATGFAGICTDAALPLCLAASVLSRVFKRSSRFVRFGRKNRRRYSRERAPRSLGKIIQYYLVFNIIHSCP